MRPVALRQHLPEIKNLPNFQIGHLKSFAAAVVGARERTVVSFHDLRMVEQSPVPKGTASIGNNLEVGAVEKEAPGEVDVAAVETETEGPNLVGVGTQQ